MSTNRVVTDKLEKVNEYAAYKYQQIVYMIQHNNISIVF